MPGRGHDCCVRLSLVRLWRMHHRWAGGRSHSWLGCWLATWESISEAGHLECHSAMTARTAVKGGISRCHADQPGNTVFWCQH